MQSFQNLLIVTIDTHFFPELEKFTFLVEEKRRALDPHGLFPVHVLLTPGSEEFSYLMFGVSQQREIKIVLLAELKVGLDIVRTNSEQDCSKFLELLLSVPKCTSFLGTSGVSSLG